MTRNGKIALVIFLVVAVLFVGMFIYQRAKYEREISEMVASKWREDSVTLFDDVKKDFENKVEGIQSEQKDISASLLEEAMSVFNEASKEGKVVTPIP